MNAAKAGFTKQQRILTPAQYQAVFEKRQSQHNSSFGIYVAKNDQTFARLGLVVSKKVSKKAVVRNTIKRRVRELFREQAADFGAIDYVVVAKTPLQQLAPKQFISELESVLVKARSRCKK